MPIKKRIILDLCGGTGAWSRPYQEAGYDVRRITLPEQDVRLFQIPEEPIHGILAAPPCTHFAVSGARFWKKKTDAVLLEGLAVVDACLRIIAAAQPAWWALENPVGRLRHYLGSPKFYFDPCDFGDPWTKRTCLWGNFTIPKKNPVKPVGQWIGRVGKPGLADHFGEFLPPDWIHRLPPSPERAMLRSITPPGFARAFFEANP